MTRNDFVVPGSTRDRWLHDCKLAYETQRSRIKSGTTWGGSQ